MRIGPTVEAAGKHVGVYKTLDFTSDETRKQAEATVDELGMRKAYEENKGRGFVLIFHKDKPDTVEKIAGSTNLADYEAAFKKFN